MRDLIGRLLRRRRFGNTAMAITAVGALAGIPFVEQCAPPPPPDWSGVGSCSVRYSDNAISGDARCSAAQANGFTRFRAECDYFVNLGTGGGFWMTTLGEMKNPPDRDPGFPEISREISNCPVPSMLYQPAGSYPTLITIHVALY